MKRIIALLLTLVSVMALPVGVLAEDDASDFLWWAEEEIQEETVAPMSEDTDLNTLDLRTPCGFTEEQLEKALRHKLKGYAWAYLKAEKEYGINAVFLASVSALESGWGRHCFKPNNIFGYGRKSFDSYEDCIDFVASRLEKNYLSEDGKYHHGTTIDAVNKSYNGRKVWAKSVKNIFGIMLRKVNDAIAAAEETTLDTLDTFEIFEFD